MKNARARLMCLALALSYAVPGATLAQEAVNAGQGAVLRALDKMNAKVYDLTIPNGVSQTTGRIDVFLHECRYPAGNPAGDAYAYVTIREMGIEEPVFKGWMIASSPALNPMNHPRYDVWVLRCTTS